MIRILFLAANPDNADTLQAGDELRQIEAVLKNTRFQVIAKPAAHLGDLRGLLREYKPQIVHFSGHGSQYGELLLVDDQGKSQSASAQALTNLFKLFRSHLRCVILNACYSDTQAAAIGGEIDCVLGFAGAIRDDAACAFATGFYSALAAGETVAVAKEHGLNEIELRFPDALQPCAISGHGDPAMLRPVDWGDEALPLPASPVSQVNISGGPAIGHDVNIEKGDFVGRDKIIVAGMGELSTRYASTVQNFLERYLGSAKRPVPFGGRAAILDDLERWLADSTAPPYTLLTAPAGRGKSALLAQWANRLRVSQQVHLIYFPISSDFNSNRETVVFAALAAQIAQLFGEPMSRAGDGREYRGIFTDYLRRIPPNGKRLLVILDGLDEAADWKVDADIFPVEPPAHLRILVSARELANDPNGEGWRTQLGWEDHTIFQTLTLPVLDLSGVAEALDQAGFVTEPNVITELYELSAGDPLMISLYIKALQPHDTQDALLQLENLRTLKPGLNAYFDQCFKAQESLWQSKGINFDRLVVNSLLDLCATSLGPLSREDIIVLAPDCFSDSHDLDLAINSLNRWIIGDGGNERGYSFSHARLGSYFVERLTKKERRDWQERFCRYGKETLTALKNKDLHPRDASSYIITHYSEHLTTTPQTSPTDFYALVCEGWLRAWESLAGTPDGFLNDAQRAWNTAESEGASAVGQMVQSALCFSSMVSTSTSISPELLTACVKANLISPQLALAMARKKIDHREKAMALASICHELPEDLQKAALDTAMAAGRCVQHEKRTETIAYIVSLAPSNQWKSILAKEQDTDIREIIKTEIEFCENWGSRCLSVDPGKLNLRELLATARTIKDEAQRSRVLHTLASNLSPSKQLPLLIEALDAIERIEDEQVRFETLKALIAELPINALNLSDRLLQVARTIRSELRYIEILGCISAHLPLIEKLPLLMKMLDIIKNIKDEYWRIEGLTIAIKYLPSSQPTPLVTALEIARSVRDEEKQARILVSLVPLVSPEQQQELLAEIEAIVDNIPYASGRMQIMTGIAAHIVGERRSPIIAKILADVNAIEFESFSSVSVLTTLTSLATSEQQQELVIELMKIACTIKDPAARSEVLCLVARLLPPTQRQPILDEALAAARDVEISFEEEGRRIEKLIKVATLFPSDKKLLVLEEALLGIQEIEFPLQDEGWRVELLRSVVELLPSTAITLLDKALDVAHSIRCLDDECIRALIIVGLHLPRNQQTSVLNEALAKACTFQDEWLRTKALLFIAEHLPSQAAALQMRLLRQMPSLVHEKESIELLDILARHWQQLCYANSVSELEEVKTILHTYSVAKRENLLGAIEVLVPIIVRLGGERAVDEIGHAILDTARWWP